jgi:hypothetical protein
MMNSILAKASIAAAAIMITLTPALADRNDHRHKRSHNVERSHQHYGNDHFGHGRHAHGRKHFGHRHWLKRYYGWNYGYGYGYGHHHHPRWR